MFAAWKLQQKGLRVLVLEKAGYVGGHCNTFYGVPGFSGVPVEMGVQVYVNTPLVRSTLEELNIATGLQGKPCSL
jgi:phytoene dehydrogenase-like protein